MYWCIILLKAPVWTTQLYPKGEQLLFEHALVFQRIHFTRNEYRAYAVIAGACPYHDAPATVHSTHTKQRLLPQIVPVAGKAVWAVQIKLLLVAHHNSRPIETMHNGFQAKSKRSV